MTMIIADWSVFKHDDFLLDKTEEIRQFSKIAAIKEEELNPHYRGDRDNARLQLGIALRRSFDHKSTIHSMSARIFYTLATDEKAAQIIRAKCHYMLGKLYHEGVGVPCDKNMADECFNNARKLGYNPDGYPVTSSTRRGCCF